MLNNLRAHRGAAARHASPAAMQLHARPLQDLHLAAAAQMQSTVPILQPKRAVRPAPPPPGASTPSTPRAAHPVGEGPGRSTPAPPAPAAGAAPVAPPQARARDDPGPDTDSLAGRLHACSTLKQLRGSYKAAKAAVGPAELAVCFNTLARISSPQHMGAREWGETRTFTRALLAASEDHLHHMSEAELLYTVAALAKLRAAPSQDWLNRFLAFSRTKLALCGPGHLTTFVRALTRLDASPGDVKRCIAFPAWIHCYCSAVRARLRGYSAHELDRTVQALALLGYQGDGEFMGALCGEVQAKLADFDGSMLARAMASFAALHYEPDRALMRRYYEEVYHKLPLFDARDLATALSAFSSLRRLLVGDFLREFLDEVIEKLPTFAPVSLGNVLLALGRMRYRPGDAWTTAVAEHVRASMWRAQGSTLVASAWGLASCGHQPSPEWLDDYLAASYTKLRSLASEDLLRAAQALALMTHRPPAGSETSRRLVRWWEALWLAADRKLLRPSQIVELLSAATRVGLPPQTQVVSNLLAQLQYHGLNHAPASGLAELLRALVRLGHHPGHEFLFHVCFMARYWWAHLSASDFGAIFHGLGVFDYAPPSRLWMMEQLAQLQCKVAEFDAPALGSLLWGVARLTRRPPHQPPSARWLADFADHAPHCFGAASPEALAQTLWGLVVMGWRPDAPWLRRWEERAAALQAQGRTFTGSQSADVAAAYTLMGAQPPPTLEAAQWVGAGAAEPPPAVGPAGGVGAARTAGLVTGLGSKPPSKARHVSLPPTRQKLWGDRQEWQRQQRLARRKRQQERRRQAWQQRSGEWVSAPAQKQPQQQQQQQQPLGGVVAVAGAT